MKAKLNALWNRPLTLASVATLCALVCTPRLEAQITALASFDLISGIYPYAGVTLSSDGGTFYGTTYAGGTNNAGTVYSLPVAGGTPTLLANFNHANGANPSAGLTLGSDGRTLYGTTYNGGANNYGTVYSVPVGGGTPTVLASFNNTNGANPWAGVTLSSDGATLYGTTYVGGASNYGTVYSLPVGGGTPTVLASFNNTNGALPLSKLTLSLDGNTLYGTTNYGGANGRGAVFSEPVSGGTPTVLASFSIPTGINPAAGVTLSLDGRTLYGTTNYGGTGINPSGTVFSLPVDGGTPTVLASFDGVNGAFPHAAVTLSSDGTTLYGTTRRGGTLYYGAVFSLPVGGGMPTVLGSFNHTNGSSPEAAVTLSSDGRTLYGTTYDGGANGRSTGGYGTVFSVPTQVPEPGTAGLLVAGLLVAAARPSRRRLR